MKTKTRTKTRGKTRTILRLPTPVRHLRELLGKTDMPEGKEMWKRMGESPLLQRLRSDPRFAEDGADLAYATKDRTHVALVDFVHPMPPKPGQDALSPQQAMLYLHQLAYYRKNLEFPLSTASLIFVVPEGAAITRKLMATFDESYRLPSIQRKLGLSEVKVDGRGARQAKNSFRYPIIVVYKEMKIGLSVSVRVVEAPPALFEATQIARVESPFFVPIPGTGGPKR